DLTGPPGDLSFNGRFPPGRQPSPEQRGSSRGRGRPSLPLARRSFRPRLPVAVPPPPRPPRRGKELPLERTGDWHVIDPLAVAPAERATPSAQEFLHYLAESRLFTTAELDGLLRENPGLDEGDASALVEALVGQGRLNDFQVSRLVAGHTFGLVLGHYRLTGRLGSGGMGVVYKAEHIHMHRTVALKLLAAEDDG